MKGCLFLERQTLEKWPSLPQRLQVALAAGQVARSEQEERPHQLQALAESGLEETKGEEEEELAFWVKPDDLPV